MKHLIKIVFVLLSIFALSCKSNQKSTISANPESNSEALQAHIDYPQVSITFDTLVEGYAVQILWRPNDTEPLKKGEKVVAGFGPADIYLAREDMKEPMVIEDVGITIPEWLDNEHVLQQYETVELHYEPVCGDEIIPKGIDQLILFADIDFDGEKELLVNMYKGGIQYANAYHAYKIKDWTVTVMEYGPFNGDDSIQDYFTEFQPEKKRIVVHHMLSSENGDNIYQFDGKGGWKKTVVPFEISKAEMDSCWEEMLDKLPKDMELLGVFEAVAGKWYVVLYKREDAYWFHDIYMDTKKLGEPQKLVKVLSDTYRMAEDTGETFVAKDEAMYGYFEGDPACTWSRVQ